MVTNLDRAYFHHSYLERPLELGGGAGGAFPHPHTQYASRTRINPCYIECLLPPPDFQTF